MNEFKREAMTPSEAKVFKARKREKVCSAKPRPLLREIMLAVAMIAFAASVMVPTLLKSMSNTDPTNRLLEEHLEAEWWRAQIACAPIRGAFKDGVGFQYKPCEDLFYFFDPQNGKEVVVWHAGHSSRDEARRFAANTTSYEALHGEPPPDAAACNGADNACGPADRVEDDIVYTFDDSGSMLGP